MMARFSPAVISAMLVIALCTGLPARPIASGQPASVPLHVTEASRRFAIPEHWIYAVMRRESGGRARAVSRAGAMGLMQIMPATWANLRAVHGLGNDPFDPRDNILAGAAYLREMHDRFGAPGFLAAYNAGPARYRRHLDTGYPLPKETRAYLAALAPLIGGKARTTPVAPVTMKAPPAAMRPVIVRDLSGLVPAENTLFFVAGTRQRRP